MKRLLQTLPTTETVVEVKNVGDNLCEIRDFVGPDRFRHDFGGEIRIRIRGSESVPANIGDSIVKFESGRLAVITAQELERHFEVIEDPYVVTDVEAEEIETEEKEEEADYGNI